MQPATRAPLAVGETLTGLAAYRDLITHRGAQILILDLGWVGGVTEARKIAALAEAFERPVAPHDCTGPVVYTAATHLSMHLPNALDSGERARLLERLVQRARDGAAGDRERDGRAPRRARSRNGASPGGLRACRRARPLDDCFGELDARETADAPVRARTTVRVMQEGWGVFLNLPATAERFTELTGVEVEVTLTVIPEMWELMERSFSGEDPPSISSASTTCS